ncbi:hypothetical protein BKA81DRAFT_371682 [Phyllosticta paracitricarpa]
MGARLLTLDCHSSSAQQEMGDMVRMWWGLLHSLQRIDGVVRMTMAVVAELVCVACKQGGCRREVSCSSRWAPRCKNEEELRSRCRSLVYGGASKYKSSGRWRTAKADGSRSSRTSAAVSRKTPHPYSTTLLANAERHTRRVVDWVQGGGGDSSGSCYTTV